MAERTLECTSCSKKFTVKAIVLPNSVKCPSCKRSLPCSPRRAVGRAVPLTRQPAGEKEGSAPAPLGNSNAEHDGESLRDKRESLSSKHIDSGKLGKSDEALPRDINEAVHQKETAGQEHSSEPAVVPFVNAG